MLGWSYVRGVPIWGAILICLAVGTLCGFINGYLVTKLGLGSLAVTIGTLALYRGIANGLLGENTVNEFPAVTTDFGLKSIGSTFMPRTLPLILLFGIFFALLLHRTPFGRRTLAIGQSPEAAKFAGVDVVKHKLIVFTFTGFMSGVAGMVYTFRFSTAQADNGVGLELFVISAIFLGGVSIFGGIGTMWGLDEDATIAANHAEYQQVLTTMGVLKLS